MKFNEMYMQQSKDGKILSILLCLNAISTATRNLYEQKSENFKQLVNVNEFVGKLSGHAVSIMEGRIDPSGDESMGASMDYGLVELLGEEKAEYFLKTLAKHLATLRDMC